MEEKKVDYLWVSELLKRRNDCEQQGDCDSSEKEMRQILYVCNVVLYGCVTWTYKKKDEEYTDSFELWLWKK